MKPRKSIKKYVTKGYRRVRYKKGYGVHSPFAFSMITQVINENMYYYAYDKIRKLRQFSYKVRFSIKGISLKKKISTKKLFLIYRLINKFSPDNILQIGTDGIVSYTLGLGRNESKLFSVCNDIERTDSTIDFFQKHVEDYNADKYHFITSDLKSGIEQLKDIPSFDFIFIHKGEGFENWNDLNLILEKANKKTVILIEGIKNDEKMKSYWGCIKSNADVKVTMDLYDFGLAIFDDKLYKHHYIVSY